jgi:bacteriocin biosynthesis cyclodehydratase domain-containing protein
VRLQLKPGLQRVRRGPATVQIGLAAPHGTLLDGLTPADLALLDRLAIGLDDTELWPDHDRDPELVRRERVLVRLLADHGLLVRRPSDRATPTRIGVGRARLSADAAAWSVTYPSGDDGWDLLADRAGRTVEIRGGGRTGLILASTLAAAGVGVVRMLDRTPADSCDIAPGAAAPSDVGRPRGQVAEQAIRRVTGRPMIDPGTAPDLVVLVERSAADALRADPLLAADIPYLSVLIRETSVLIGPLVVPGHGPCLRCLDLHRSDRDRQWPTVLNQLLADAAQAGPREETAVAQLAAGLAALQVLTRLDGRRRPTTVGATLEVELPDGLVARRPWPAHPSCGCHWPPGSATGPQRVATRAASPAG